MTSSTSRRSPGLKVRFWGVRGSIACPGPKTHVYGGNTSCIEVQGGAETILLDAGTGLREAGVHLMRPGRPVRVHLLISHTHWDHIQGFPFFSPIYAPGNEIFVYGPRSLERSLREAVLHQMQYSYFPVRGVELQAKVQFRELGEESFSIGDLHIRTHPMNHPIRVLAYRISKGSRSVVYTGDNEPYYDVTGGADPSGGQAARFIQECNDRVVEFVRGSSALIADAQYTDEEYASKRGWGHTSLGDAVALGAKAGVKSLVLFHHEPAHDDAVMKRLEQDAVRRAKKLAPKMRVLAAREGMELGV